MLVRVWAIRPFTWPQAANGAFKMCVTCVYVCYVSRFPTCLRLLSLEDNRDAHCCRIPAFLYAQRAIQAQTKASMTFSDVTVW